MTARTTLNSVIATGGFLANCPVEFAPGLTCIIGARGTCKSTLVESIRFAFDHEPDRVRQLTGESESKGAPTFNLIKETLGAGSIRCSTAVAGSSGGSAYVIEREVGAGPRVFVDGVREHATKEVLHRIEIFSQGDLQLIADDGHDELRLALIDRRNATTVEELRTERATCSEQLREIGPQLRVVRAQVAGLRQDSRSPGSHSRAVASGPGVKPATWSGA